MDPRTLRSRVRSLLGIRLGEYMRRPGWEWALEAALRQQGYLRDAARRQWG
ncbi:MAG: hypothetical protein ACREOF_00840 [Gemmatimonadales bacterium]